MKRILSGLVSGWIAVSLAFPAGLMAQAPAGQPAEGAAPPAAPQGEKSFNQEELDQILAPIALYPDALLAQILMASTYPLEIVEAARWSKANPNVKDKALEDAMQQQPWDPSVKSLTAFPQVLTMMNDKLDWTQKLGDAFLAQQQDVMATVQGLRLKAHEQGNLKDTPEQKVIVEKETKETIIKIEPADPQVVYVPTYNTTVVYGTWPYPAYPPYYYYPPGYVAGTAFWSFAAGVAVGSALWGNCNWRGNNVYINHNNYNNFNRTNISSDRWNHNVNHRKGVAYRDQRVAQQYNRGIDRDAARNRDQFRGRAEQGRQDLGQGRFDSGRPGGDRGGGPGVATRDVPRGQGDRGGAGGPGDRGGPGAGTRDIPGGRGDRGGPSAGTRDMGGGGRDFGGSRDFSGTGRSSGFDGAGQGRQARDFSSRGASSRQSMGGGGGGFSRGGGGGGRGGGGGGRR